MYSPIDRISSSTIPGIGASIVLILGLFVSSCGDPDEAGSLEGDTGPSADAGETDTGRADTSTTVDADGSETGEAALETEFDRAVGLLDDDAWEDDSSRAWFEQKLGEARETYRRGDVCEAADDLVEAMERAQNEREERGAPHLEELYNRIRGLRANIIVETDRVGACDGHERVGRPLDVTVGESTTEKLAASVQFGAARTQTRYGAGELYTALDIEPIEAHSHEPGLPGIPVWRRLVAIPVDAEVRLDNVETTPAETITAHLYPHQKPTLDQDREAEPPNFDVPPFTDDGFVIDRELYEAGELFPSDGELCRIRDVGEIRELRLAQVSCFAGQYDTSTSELTLFADIDFSVAFDGGKEGFVSSSTLENPFEIEATYTDSVLNSEIVTEVAVEHEIPELVDTDESIGDCSESASDRGEELLILTHPDFRAAADRLAQHKRNRGLAAEVFSVRDGAFAAGPDTFNEIKSLVLRRYTTCEVRPKYLLLLGDAEYIPPGEFEADPGAKMKKKNFSDGDGKKDTESISSDLNYGRMTASWMPDIAVGRLTVDTVAESERVVDRIIQHETSPPTDAEFYDDISLAGLFECCRVETDADDETKTVADGETGSATFDLPAGVEAKAWHENAEDEPLDLTVEDANGTAHVDESGAKEGKPFSFSTDSGGEFTVEVENGSGDELDVDLRVKWPLPASEQPYKPGTDSKTYIETVEYLRDRLRDEDRNVERIYATRDPAWDNPKKTGKSNNYEESDFTFGDDTPNYYPDGSLLPPELRVGSGFAWDGDQNDVHDAFNDGSVFVVHRDHGWSGGWWKPLFNKNSITSSNLTNRDELSIAFSINCASGFFANEVDDDDGNDGHSYHAERLTTRDVGGAVAAIAAVQNTGTSTNNIFVKGMFDAVWPSVLSDFGPDRRMKRLGDVFHHGLAYLVNQRDLPQPGEEPNHLAKQLAWWHIHGDPSLLVRTEPPTNVPSSYDVALGDSSAVVNYEVESATITGLQIQGSQTVPIGRAVVEQGAAEMDYYTSRSVEWPMLFAVELPDGSARLLSDSPGVAEPLADASNFTSDAELITFDNDLTDGQSVRTRFQQRGVQFISTDSGELHQIIVANDTERGFSTSSPPNAILNRYRGQAGSSSPVDEGRPLIMNFKPAIQRVGMQVGGGDGTSTVAIVAAYGPGGRLLGTHSIQPVPGDVDAFVGLEASSSAITQVRVYFPPGDGGELVDDLIFE